MTILVTGSSGFTGEVLIPKLKQNGFDVLGIDLLPGTYTDIVKDISKPFDIDKKIDVIIHLAATLEHHRSSKKEYFEKNVLTTENALTIAKKNNSFFIYVSTVAVYGFPKCPISENTPTNPVGDYARTKLQGENICNKYRENGLKISIIRPSVIIGKKRMGVYQTIFKNLYANSFVPLVGDGNNKISFVDVNDLVEFLLFVVQKQIDGILVNFGGSIPGTLAQIIMELKTYTKSRSRITHIPSQLTILLKILSYIKLLPITPWQVSILIKDFYFDNSKLFSLGFNYSCDTLSALKSMADYYKDNVQKTSH